MRNRPMLKGFTDYVKEAQILAKNGLLFHLVCQNKGGADCFIQLHDLATGTGTSAAPEFEVMLPGSTFIAFPFHEAGWQFGNGIYVRAVTAAGGSTLIASSDVKFTYQFDGPWPLS